MELQKLLWNNRTYETKASRSNSFELLPCSDAPAQAFPFLPLSRFKWLLSGRLKICLKWSAILLENVWLVLAPNPNQSTRIKFNGLKLAEASISPVKEAAGTFSQPSELFYFYLFCWAEATVAGHPTSLMHGFEVPLPFQRNKLHKASWNAVITSTRKNILSCSFC